MPFTVCVVQSLSRVWLFDTPRTAARQVSLSFTISRSLLKSVSIDLAIPPNHLILCRPLLLLPSAFPSCLQPSPASKSFPMSGFFAPGGQSIGISVSVSVLPMNIQGWFPLGLMFDLSEVQVTQGVEQFLYSLVLV